MRAAALCKAQSPVRRSNQTIVSLWLCGINNDGMMGLPVKTYNPSNLWDAFSFFKHDKKKKKLSVENRIWW